jgi:hypothetical protein
MVVFHSLKRYFPNTPDWVIGGLILVIILWSVVLPIEALQAITRQDFLRPSSSVWLIRSLYMFGYSTSLALISPWTNSQLSLSNLRLIVVALGLLIVSPVYFAAGALLTKRKTLTITLGILILTMMTVLGCLAMAATLFTAD